MTINDKGGYDQAIGLLCEAVDALDATKTRLRELEQERQKDIIEVRKYLSPGNANTEIRPLIRDLAQAKMTAVDNYETIARDLASLRGYVQHKAGCKAGSGKCAFVTMTRGECGALPEAFIHRHCANHLKTYRHKFIGFDCTCGLDKLFSTLPTAEIL